MTIVSQLCFGCNNVRNDDNQQELSANQHKKTPNSANGTALFEGSPVLNLAKAIEKENFTEVKAIIRNNPQLLQYEEEYFGCNILEWAIFNEKLKATQILLESGADPNFSKIGQSAITAASTIRESSEYLKLVLKYGGNPNQLVVDSISKGTQQVTYNTPLITAAVISSENVKLLIAAGADVNLHTPNNFSPLYVALISGKFDIMEDLINHNADFKNILIPNSEGGKMDILESIDKLDYTPNSERQKRKMAFIEFLKSKGLVFEK